MKIFQLEQRKAIQILMFLHRKGNVIFKDLIDEVGGDYRTLDKAMRTLTELGLVTDVFKRGRPSKRYLGLTEKGEKVVEILNRLEEILSK